MEVSMGTISARGQVAIPIGIREKMRLKEGEKVIFLCEDDSLMMKKISTLSWAELTKPLRDAKKKITESQVNDLIHAARAKKA